ncbi:MAG: ABC transporter substrate-binding protein [Armatimonadetes bacterium]|nr:ABC transporter substrate-binding protein [Armatimonadota bacterium]
MRSLSFPVILGLAALALLFLGGGAGRAALLDSRFVRDSVVVGQAFPKQLVDPAGTALELPRPPQRIISTFMAGDEMLAALVDFSRIAGVSPLVDDESSGCAGQIPPSVPRVRVECESLLALEPDLLLVASYTRAETVRQLVAAGVPVVHMGQFSTMEDVTKNLRLVAAAVGSERAADQVSAEVDQRVAKTAAKVGGLPKPRVLYCTAAGFTFGSDAIIDTMIDLAGGFNVVREMGISGPTRVSPEAAAGLQPDVVLLSAKETGDRSAVEEFLRYGAWGALFRGSSTRIVSVKSAWLLSMSHHGARGVEAVARLLHPEAFAK